MWPKDRFRIPTLSLAHGKARIQGPCAGRVISSTIPYEVKHFLGAKKTQVLAWIGMHAGTEADSEKVAISFLVDEDKPLEPQIRRILRLLE